VKYSSGPREIVGCAFCFSRKRSSLDSMSVCRSVGFMIAIVWLIPMCASMGKSS